MYIEKILLQENVRGRPLVCLVKYIKDWVTLENAVNMYRKKHTAKKYLQRSQL